MAKVQQTGSGGVLITLIGGSSFSCSLESTKPPDVVIIPFVSQLRSTTKLPFILSVPCDSSSKNRDKICLICFIKKSSNDLPPKKSLT